ncbi:MAG: hypothetical protein O9283_03210 [Sphingomonadaceae bacterium]|nr:hypothetical protein [Sphingomonadaceae bacterium]
MYYSKPLMSYEAICQVLDDAAEAAGRPLDWRKPLYAAIDELHAASAPEEQVRIAERISIVLLRLDWAILRRDSDKAAAARSELAELGETWRALVGAEPLDLEDVVSPEQDAPVAFEAAAESGPAPAALETGVSGHFQMPSSIDFQAFRSGPLKSERIDFDAARRDSRDTFGAEAVHDDDDSEGPGIDFLAVSGAQAQLQEPSTIMDDQDVESMTEALERITLRARYGED